MSSTAFRIVVVYSTHLKFSWIKLPPVAYAVHQLYYDHLVWLSAEVVSLQAPWCQIFSRQYGNLLPCHDYYRIPKQKLTDALVSTLMNSFVGNPNLAPFKIILWLVHKIHLRIKHVPNILHFLLWFISKNFQWFFLSLLAGSGIWWRISHSPSFSNIDFFWRYVS